MKEWSESLLEEMKKAIKRPAVAKLALAKLRASFPDIPIFAFEGDDDKIVYSQWIGRIRDGFEYEALPCSGKMGVLQLVGVVARDKGSIGKSVYFFIDRDYDDYADCSVRENISMTDRYSIENYLVCVEVLMRLLRDEFHCHALPEKRREICELFEVAYSAFLQCTKNINRRIYVARRLGIKMARSLPSQLSALASVSLTSVKSGSGTPEGLVPFVEEPNADDIYKISSEFDAFDGRERYHGKFAFMFFRRWLNRLVEEFTNPELALFNGVLSESSVRQEGLNIGNFASKSPFPTELVGFINSI